MAFRELKYDIERLRHLMREFDYCNETFLSRFTYQELWTLGQVWMAGDWDIYPDRWTRAQITDALRYGIPPEFRYSDESPVTYEATEDDIRSLSANEG